MKNEYSFAEIDYPSDRIEGIYDKYLLLKKDATYQFCYKVLAEFLRLKRQVHKLKSKDVTLAEDLKLTINSLTFEICRNWNLVCPVSPNLRLKKKDFSKLTIKRYGSLAKVLYAFNVSLPFYPSPYIKPSGQVWFMAFYPSGMYKEPTVTVETLLKTQDVQKFLILVLSQGIIINKVRISVPLRLLGRIFNLDKNTISRWLEEAKEWPESERERILYTLTNKQRQFNKDAYDLDNQKRDPYHEYQRKPPATPSSTTEESDPWSLSNLTNP